MYLNKDEMSAKHDSFVRSLYKKILRLHENLPVDLKTFGDLYVKSEFRLHKNCSPEFVPENLSQWKEYANNLENHSAGIAGLGKTLPEKTSNEFLEVQILQLHELMQETTKPNMQFNIKDDWWLLCAPKYCTMTAALIRFVSETKRFVQ